MTCSTGELVAEAAGAAARAGPHGHRDRPARQPEQPECRAQSQRRAGGGSCRSGSRFMVLNASNEGEIDAAFATIARAASRRALVGRGSVLQQPARSTRRAGGPPCASRDLRIARVRRGRRPDELRHQLRPTPIVRSASTPAGFSKAPSPPICRSCNRPSSSWSSTSRPPRRLALTFRRPCSPAPTR